MAWRPNLYGWADKMLYEMAREAATALFHLTVGAVAGRVSVSGWYSHAPWWQALSIGLMIVLIGEVGFFGFLSWRDRYLRTWELLLTPEAVIDELQALVAEVCGGIRKANQQVDLERTLEATTEGLEAVHALLARAIRIEARLEPITVKLIGACGRSANDALVAIGNARKTGPPMSAEERRESDTQVQGLIEDLHTNAQKLTRRLREVLISRTKVGN